MAIGADVVAIGAVGVCGEAVTEEINAAMAGGTLAAEKDPGGEEKSSGSYSGATKRGSDNCRATS